MRHPNPPFIELGFYFAKGDGEGSLQMLLSHLSEGGASARVASIRHGSKLPMSWSDDPGHDRRISKNEELWKLFSNEDVTVTKVTVESGTSIVPGSRELVVQLPISPQAASLDHNPVAIWIEGAAFSYPAGCIPSKARKVGRRVFEAFHSLVVALQPSYGAITVDYGMPCPSELVYDDARTLAFKDFYLSREFFGDDVLSSVRELEPNAYHELLSDGQMTLCYDAFAPRDIDVSPDDAEHLSIAVGKLIAARSRRS